MLEGKRRGSLLVGGQKGVFIPAKKSQMKPVSMKDSYADIFSSAGARRCQQKLITRGKEGAKTATTLKALDVVLLDLAKSKKHLQRRRKGPKGVRRSKSREQVRTEHGIEAAGRRLSVNSMSMFATHHTPRRVLSGAGGAEGSGPDTSSVMEEGMRRKSMLVPADFADQLTGKRATVVAAGARGWQVEEPAPGPMVGMVV